jgi:hypothetical protein
MRQSRLRDRLYETSSRSSSSSSSSRNSSKALSFRPSKNKSTPSSPTKNFMSTTAISSIRTFEDAKDGFEEEEDDAHFMTSSSKVPETTISSREPSKSTPEEPGFLESLNLKRGQMKKILKGSFLYMKQRRDGTTAYDLEVVSHEKAVGSRNMYYTLSKAGLTCFKSDGETTFTSLTDMELEYGIYHKIQRIPFFQKYRSWKCFYAWRKCISRRKRRIATRSLKKKMFLFDSKLQKPLLSVFNMCADTRATELIEVERSKTYQLDDFKESQKHRRAFVQKRISKFTENIVQMIRKACDQVLDVFIVKNKIDAEHRLTFMERATLRRECQKLTRFIRLSDFIIKDTMRNMALDSVQSFLGNVCPKIQPTRVIRVTVDDQAKKKVVVLSRNDKNVRSMLKREAREHLSLTHTHTNTHTHHSTHKIRYHHAAFSHLKLDSMPRQKRLNSHQISIRCQNVLMKSSRAQFRSSL